MSTTLEHKLEAILFYKGEPETVQRIATLLEVSEEEVLSAAEQLGVTLGQRAVRLLHINDELQLVTAPEVSEVVRLVRKEEVMRELGKAGAETLAIVLYRGPIARARIEYIRGVNCSFVLRNLLIRGLVERVKSPTNERAVLYRATPDLLTHLGVTAVTELPDYVQVQHELDSFEQQKNDAEDASMMT